MTPQEVTASIIKSLMEQEIIALLHPETKERVTVDHEVAQNLIKGVTEIAYAAIKDINVHRPLDVPEAS